MRLTRRHGRGFTLIEVMITMFVIAVGLLSSAAMQAISKRVNYDAVQRTTATMLAQDIVERMRANQKQLVSYLTTDAGSVTAAADCSSATCSTSDLASYDLATWARSLQGAETKADSQNAGGLADATGCVYKGGTDGLYVVAVAWRGVIGQAPPDSTDASDDPARYDCGQGLGRYDDPSVAGTDDRMRRIVVIQTFISDPYAAATPSSSP